MTADESRPEWLEPLVDQRDPRLLDVERWFKRVGVPHFIEGYSSADRVHGRTVPVVGILVMTQLVLGSSWSGRSSISAWGKVLGLLIGIQVLWTIASQTFRRRHPRADLTAGERTHVAGCAPRSIFESTSGCGRRLLSETSEST